MRTFFLLPLAMIPALPGFAPIESWPSIPACEVTHTLWRDGKLLGNIHSPIALEPPVPPNMGILVPTRAFNDVRELTQIALMDGLFKQQQLLLPVMRRNDAPMNPGPVALEPMDPSELAPSDSILQVHEETTERYVQAAMLSLEHVTTPHPQILAACPWLRAVESFWLVHWFPRSNKWIDSR